MVVPRTVVTDLNVTLLPVDQSNERQFKDSRELVFWKRTQREDEELVKTV